MGGNVRAGVAEGRGDAIPIFLHEIPKLFHQKIVKPDVALIHVSINQKFFNPKTPIKKLNLIFVLGFATRSTRIL